MFFAAFSAKSFTAGGKTLDKPSKNDTMEIQYTFYEVKYGKKGYFDLDRRYAR